MKLRFSDIISPNKKKSGVLFLSVIALLVLFCGSLANNGVYASTINKEIPADATVLEGLPESYGNGEMAWPVPNYYLISSAYGTRYDGADFHMGIDISGEDIQGASVIAAESGTVVRAVTEYVPGRGYGKQVIIKHDGNVGTLYAKLDEILVKAGDKVEKGQVIAKVGSTGFANEPHLHFEVREGAETADPVAYFMPAEELK